MPTRAFRTLQPLMLVSSVLACEPTLLNSFGDFDRCRTIVENSKEGNRKKMGEGREGEPRIKEEDDGDEEEELEKERQKAKK
ncbi:hypothetical protein PoB_005218900 [Plakobranchus ocellatus]|uniref:Uncharacterized protein n=1 Tax=Plakobranchus ocellatus TaxID=259542 RepID=A0AAV4BZK6_9GAST|nr:hypothetical protein PoB_005218900 [Plakobranchus ocellatus]